jgi:hypothetical protein
MSVAAAFGKHQENLKMLDRTIDSVYLCGKQVLLHTYTGRRCDFLKLLAMNS